MRRNIYVIVLMIISQLFTLLIAAQETQKVDLYIETGHSDQIYGLAISPDRKIVASGNDDTTIKLWSVETGVEIRTLVGHSKGVISVAFSPNGNILASGGSDKTIKIWDIASGKQLKSLEGHTEWINSISFSPDGKFLASASQDGSIIFWDVVSGNQLRTIKGQYFSVRSAVFSPDGKTLVSVGNALQDISSGIKFWDVGTGQLLRSLRGKNETVTPVAYSPNGKLLISGSSKGLRLWNVATGRQIKEFIGHTAYINSVVFSPDGKKILSGSSDRSVKLWDIATGRKLKSFNTEYEIHAASFSLNGKELIVGDGNTLKLLNIETKKEIWKKPSPISLITSIDYSPDGNKIAIGSSFDTLLFSIDSRQKLKSLLPKYRGFRVVFSPDGKILAGGSYDKTIKFWNVETGQELLSLKGHTDSVSLFAFSPNGKTFVSRNEKDGIKFWDVNTGLKTKSIKDDRVQLLAFSPDGKTLFGVSERMIFWDAPGGKTIGEVSDHITGWDVETGNELKSFKVGSDQYIKGEGELLGLSKVIDGGKGLGLSKDGKVLALWNFVKNSITLWDVEKEQLTKTLEGHRDEVTTVAFSPDGKILASGSRDRTINLWELETGKLLKSLKGHTDNVISITYSPDGKFLLSGSWDGTVKFWDVKSGKLLATLFTLDKEDWIVTTPEGHFDTNKSLDRIEGLHWIVNEEFLKPLPLDVFMRQYYELGLLQRVLKCNEENNCDTEFKPLPSIADINRVQPKVSIKEIKSITNSSDLADVTVEVESTTEDVSISATDRTKKVKLTSGAFDLRLFRDGQLVGVSTPKAKLEPFIKAAPDLIGKNKEYFKRTGKLTNTPEDVAWREANDIFALVGTENVKRISPEKLEYTFRNVKLPKGQTSVEFTAYAFNSDKVKSTTTEPFKFEVPKTIAAARKKGRAFVVSIGVNVSENPAYNLQYAANDARKMQEIVGARLEADSGKYAEVVKIPLVSDYDKNKNLTENTAQKAIIKGVFSLLSGNEKEIQPEILKQIPNREQIKQIEPEDTLIITFSGHGYADNAGIFYLLPYDIGKDTLRLSSAALQKTVSSDELSLWMQDITAAEMIMIIDACHSSAAVQGDGFKPGPMGSRGLGQLAYDKDMKILSATQADNVALELGSLQQGLLSYALLEDGIVKSLADTDKNKKLFSDEWLGFAEKRVPELYSEVKDGRRDIIIDGKVIKSGGSRTAEIISSVGKKNVNLDLQQPTVFDFKRRNAKNVLFSLP